MQARIGGRYDIVREIAMGGMGQVFEAIDVETGRPVAVKMMIAGAELNLQALLRFQQEGAVLATLKHPNIVRVFGSFMEEERCSIVMELIAGQSLETMLRRSELPLAQIRTVVEQVLSALAYAHSRGIVHRDIKPDNIMVGEGDRVKVTDFGIARILAPGSILNTRTGTAIGTPHYMSPEQIEGAKVDGRCDLYSLGAVMYRMAAGRPPFEGDDPFTIAFAHVHRAPQPPTQINAEIPADWEAVILRALAKNPADRYQTADAMGSAVSRLSTSYATPEPGSASHPDTVERIISPERSAAQRPVEDEETSATAEVPRESNAGQPASPVGPAPQPPPSGTGSARSRVVEVPLAPAGEGGPGREWTRHRVWYIAAAGVGAIVLLALLALVLSRPSKSPSAGSQPTSTESTGSQHAGAGRLLGAWGSVGSGPAQLDVPAGIAIGPRGKVFVADYDNNRISIFSRNGRPLEQWTLTGPGAGQYVSPNAVAVGPHGAVYVSDGDNNRIMVLNAHGRLLRTWGKRGTGPGEFQTPVDVGLDSKENVYVLDRDNNRVEKFSPKGKFLAAGGSKGSGPGQLQYPVSLAINVDGYVLVADQANYRVQLFTTAGKFETQWGTQGKGRGQFEAVSGVAIDDIGDVYVADATLGRVQKFTPGGTFLASWGKRGPRRDWLKEPVSLAIDGHVLYVLDGAKGRVVKYATGG